MSTRFYDEMTAIGPTRWYRMHSATPETEPNVGTISGKDFIGISGSVTAQQAGPLQDGQTTYSVQFASGGYLVRNTWDSAEFGSSVSDDQNGSILFFFKTPGTGAFQWVLGLHPTNHQFAVFINNSGLLDFRVINAANSRTQVADTAALTDNQWHMAVITSDGASTNSIYIDGVLTAFTVPPSGTGTLAASAWQGDVSYGTATFRVGQSPRYPSIPGNDFPFVGYLSEIAFFDDALTAGQVEALWSASQVLPTPPAGAGGHRYKGRRTFAGF